MSDQYLRKWSLVVSPNTGSAPVDGISLSDLRMVFSVTQADVESPNNLVARVYNLSRTTAQRIQNEFQHVALQAGYEGGQLAVIFEGTIKQVRRGRESAIDSFVDIYAADGDTGYNFAVVNKALAAGASLNQQVDAIAQSMAPFDVTKGSIPNELGTGGTLPRGKVLFGMARERMTNIGDTAGASWSIQNGKLTLIPVTGYLPDEALVLNSRTGLVGVPEATNNGVEVTCLLNPRIKIGTRVQINNADINQTTVLQQGSPRYADLSFPANVTNDGFYRVLVVEHHGDSRGQEWYSTLTCLAVDPSSPAGQSVLPDG